MNMRDIARMSAGSPHPVSWPAGPATPTLAPGEAHVWRADLDAVADDVLDGLSDDEQRRAAAIAGQRERSRWSRSRGVLRTLIGRYLRCAPADVRLAVAAHGKPQLLHVPPTAARLFFNISHSQQLALYAFSADESVGVDVQVTRDRGTRESVDHIALARRAFGEHEAQRLSLVEPARRESEFLRAWTLHEAGLKRLGIGIAGSGPTPGDAAGAAGAWTVELDVGRGVAAALALASPAGDLRLWRLA
jgi:4'-phosphopantetheinyl transferase